MSVAKISEISSGSAESFDDAIRKGIDRANRTLNNITEAWVGGQKVVVRDGEVVEYRVNLKVTFVLED
ncbi:MAG: dodecin family protein [Thermoanaerobaculia bacterium]